MVHFRVVFSLFFKARPGVKLSFIYRKSNSAITTPFSFRFNSHTQTEMVELNNTAQSPTSTRIRTEQKQTNETEIVRGLVQCCPVSFFSKGEDLARIRDHSLQRQRWVSNNYVDLEKDCAFPYIYTVAYNIHVTL